MTRRNARHRAAALLGVAALCSCGTSAAPSAARLTVPGASTPSAASTNGGSGTPTTGPSSPSTPKPSPPPPQTAAVQGRCPRLVGKFLNATGPTGERTNVGVELDAPPGARCTLPDYPTSVDLSDNAGRHLRVTSSRISFEDTTQEPPLGDLPLDAQNRALSAMVFGIVDDLGTGQCKERVHLGRIALTFEGVTVAVAVPPGAVPEICRTAGVQIVNLRRLGAPLG